MSFNESLSSNDDKGNRLLATSDRVSTPDCLSAKLSSSPIPVEVPVVMISALEEPLVPLDLSMPSAARTCSEELKVPSQRVETNKPLLVPDYPEIRLPRPLNAYNQLSSNPFCFFIGAPSNYFPGEAAQLLRATRISARQHLKNYERRFIPDGYLGITKKGWIQISSPRHLALGAESQSHRQRLYPDRLLKNTVEKSIELQISGS